MKITSIDKEIKKVFETGYYHIPRFQRPYSWEKDHVAEFWNDAVLESETDYFIGSIVVFKKENELFGIVDGQQRLTTITLILCALRDFYLSNNFENLAKGVHSLIEKIDLNNKKHYILQTESSYPYFQEYIQKYDEPDTNVELGSEEENLKNAFDLINRYIESELTKIRNDKQINDNDRLFVIQRKLNEIRDKVLRLKVIYIELEDEDDAYIIFETLNTRGKDLRVADLVKNYLTKLIKAKNANVDIPKDKWNVIRDNIDSTSMDLDLDTFLLHVWLSKYEFTTTKVLYKKIKSTIKQKHASSFLDELTNDSITYKTIFDPETRKWDKQEEAIKFSLKTLSDFNVTQQTPIVLSVMRGYNNKSLRFKYVKELLESIEHFHYIFTAITSQRSSGGIASMYSMSARKLTNSKDEQEQANIIKELRQKMREKIPTYDEFYASFKTLRYTNDYTKQKRIIAYTLSKIDKYLNTNGASINYYHMTLEHILPQNPSIKEIGHNDFVGLIGNLILVDELTNNKLDNKNFIDKKAILLNTNLFVDETIKLTNSWDKESIEKRTEKLAQIAYNEAFKI